MYFRKIAIKMFTIIKVMLKSEKRKEQIRRK